MIFNDFKQIPDSFSTESETTGPLAGADSAISLLGKAILPKAVELARAGKYPEAENLLQHLIREGAAIPGVYDLMARIRAQQGRLLEAQTFWAEAIRQNSSKESYRAALKCIEHWQKHPVWFRRLRQFWPGLLLVLGTVCIITAVRPYLHNWNTPSINPKPKLSRQTANTPAEKPPEVAIDIPGVLVKTQTGQVIVTFEFGLFSQLTELRPEAKTILDLLAKQLQPYVGRIQVNVEGHTDDLPILRQLIYRDNISLGLQRAVTVIDYLRLNCGLPAGMFEASSMGELQYLYPNDSFDNQLRNRTVVIRITAIKE